MPQIVAVHSFRGGTGKSNTTANVASLLAASGKRVGVVDTDIQSPGIHVILGLDGNEARCSLNDFLWGNCSIGDAAHDVTHALGDDVPGKLFLVPARLTAGDISRVVREGFDFNLLTEGLTDLGADLALDFLFLDTHPGINEETLFALALSGLLVLVLRPDMQDLLGTAVAIEVARHLDVPQILVVLNKVPRAVDVDGLRRNVEQMFSCRVAAVIPHSDELMILGSQGIFALKSPDDSVTSAFRALSDAVLAA